MQLLNELLGLSEHNEFFLTENLGKLKDLGLGRMINAFKQSFSQSGGGNSSRLTSTNVGSKLQSRATGIGQNSSVIELGRVRNWPHVKREILANKEGTAGIIFKVNEKPVALLVTQQGGDMVNNMKSVVGMAWDFSNISASEEELQAVLATLSADGDSGGYKPEKKYKVDSKASTVQARETGYDGKPKKDAKIKEYTGHAATMAQVVAFIKAAVEALGSRFEFSIITYDKEAQVKRGDRAGNRPIDPKELKLFKDGLKTRLAKYKNSKIDSAVDAQDLLEKIFSGSMKSVKYAGTVYNAEPDSEYIAVGDGKKAHGVSTNFHKRLIAGKPFEVKFSSKDPGKYNSLYIKFALINKAIHPVELKYEVDGKYVTEKI